MDSRSKKTRIKLFASLARLLAWLMRPVVALAGRRYAAASSPRPASAAPSSAVVGAEPPAELSSGGSVAAGAGPVEDATPKPEMMGGADGDAIPDSVMGEGDAEVRTSLLAFDRSAGEASAESAVNPEQVSEADAAASTAAVLVDREPSAPEAPVAVEAPVALEEDTIGVTGDERPPSETEHDEERAAAGEAVGVSPLQTVGVVEEAPVALEEDTIGVAGDERPPSETEHDEEHAAAEEAVGVSPPKAVGVAEAEPEDSLDTASIGSDVGPADADPAAAAEREDVAEESSSSQPAGRYRPRLRERGRGEATTARAATGSGASQGGTGSLEADLLISVGAGGLGISIAVLLRRQPDMPSEVTVKLLGEARDVLAIDDGLFEPVALSNPAAVLSTGFVAETYGSAPKRWVRTGRRLYGFSGRQGVSGFASVPRVLIGQENIVLCEAELADGVIECCALAGSDAPIEVSGPGVPAGWKCFRGIRPRHPGQWRDREEFFLALSPLPDAIIEFVGGLSIGRNEWLAGRPPAIRLLGAHPKAGEVTIDGLDATLVDEAWIVPSWDCRGPHVVRYAGLSRSYSISEPPTDWQAWPAHVGAGLEVVGAHVGTAGGRKVVVLGSAPCWLLGAKPGQVAWASAANGLAVCRTANFTPVWAVPPKAGRRRPSPVLLDVLEPPETVEPGTPSAAIRQWGRLIRDATGGQLASGIQNEAEALWRLYAASARALRKHYR